MKNSLLVTALVATLALLASGCQLGGSSSSAPEGEMATTAPQSRSASASYENGLAACRRAQRTDALPPFGQYLRGDREVAARRYLDNMRRIVRANLQLGNDFGIATQGCLEAAWPKNVPVPSRGLHTLVGGETLTFPPGVIHPHETLTCVSNGIRVKAVVPPAGQANIFHADGLHDSAEIRVTTRADGTVIAACR